MYMNALSELLQRSSPVRLVFFPFACSLSPPAHCASTRTPQRQNEPSCLPFLNPVLFFLILHYLSPPELTRATLLLHEKQEALKSKVDFEPG
jgi:hypothetical protein